MSGRRPAILAVDAGGSKVDVALVRRDGTLLGAARVRGAELDGRTWLTTPHVEERHLMPVGVAIEEAAASGRGGSPIACRSPTSASSAWPAPTFPPTIGDSCDGPARTAGRRPT